MNLRLSTPPLPELSKIFNLRRVKKQKKKKKRATLRIYNPSPDTKKRLELLKKCFITCKGYPKSGRRRGPFNYQGGVPTLSTLPRIAQIVHDLRTNHLGDPTLLIDNLNPTAIVRCCAGFVHEWYTQI